MQEPYQKMYATLVGRVDDSISALISIATQDTCDKQRILLVAKDLKKALLEAEDMYLNA